jgi:hypothetical protein
MSEHYIYEVDCTLIGEGGSQKTVVCRCGALYTFPSIHYTVPEIKQGQGRYCI